MRTGLKKTIALLLLSFVSMSIIAAPTKPEKLTVILDWYPNPDHAPLVIAQQLGYFKEQGLDVTLISPADPNDPPKLIAASKADIGITYEPEFMQQVDQGLPLISIGTLIDKPLNCLVMLKNGKIKSISELKGKTIATTSSGLASILLKRMLEMNGLSEKDVTLVNVRYNLMQALLSHQVDAVNGLNRNIEVPTLESNNHQVSAFFPEDYGIPNYSELIFITNQTRVNDPRLPRFLTAIKKAVAWLDTHPKEAWQLFIKRYPETNTATNREAWFTTLPYFAEEPGDVNEKEWRQFAVFMQQNKLISETKPVSRYAVEVIAGEG